MGTSGSHQVLAPPIRTSSIIFSASVVLDLGWRLVGPGLVGHTIGVVCVAVAMAEKGGSQVRKLVFGFEGQRVRDRGCAEPLQGCGVSQ